MANEYLIKKWRLWFKFLDAKNTGKVSREDEKREEEEFVKLAHLEGERKEEVLKTSSRLWEQFVFRGKAGPITEDEFVEMTKYEFEADRDKFVEKMKQGCVDEFKILDQTGQGLLDEEMFINGFKAAGIQNETWIKMFFQAFNPVSGNISLDVYRDAMVQFMVDEDNTKKDIFIEALESYPGDDE